MAGLGDLVAEATDAELVSMAIDWLMAALRSEVMYAHTRAARRPTTSRLISKLTFAATQVKSPLRARGRDAGGASVGRTSFPATVVPTRELSPTAVTSAANASLAQITSPSTPGCTTAPTDFD